MPCQKRFINEYNEFFVIVDFPQNRLYSRRAMEMKVEVKSKKESVITLRLDADTTRIIKQLAKKDERTTSWMARK